MQYYNEISPHPYHNGSLQKEHNTCWWRCGEKEILQHCWLECKSVLPLLKTIGNYLKELKIEIFVYINKQTHNSSSTPWYLPEKTRTLIQKGTWFLMFIAALCTNAKMWKQPNCEYHSEIPLNLKKKNGSFPLAATWMDLEGIMLSEASLVAQMVKNLPAMQETRFDPWVWKIPWRRE